MRTLHAFHGGVHPPENKQQSSGNAIRPAGLPPRLYVPLNQSIGNPAKSCVAVGELVLKGQRLAEADGTVSVAVHAPTSGTVVAIEPHVFAHPSGLAETSVVIEPDGEDRWTERRPFDWRTADTVSLRRHLRDMGVVGLGGAVFPTNLKIGATGLATLVVNGAECEPFITCDDRLMRERAADIVNGIRILAELMQPQETLVGIEDNKPEAIAAMRAACAGTAIDVVAVPTVYPGGGAKQLIKVLTGKEVPAGVRSTDLGVQCFNVATVYSVWRALELGEPLISRVLTLTGAVGRPHNVEALIGTPAGWLIRQAEPAPKVSGVIMGGPMMGFELPSLEAGITKASNCLIAKNDALFPPRPPALPCIRCGDCAEACPAELQPMDLYWFAKAKNFGRAQETGLFDCIECGACSYVCPSQIPLVDYYRFAKDEIWAAERDKKAAELARTRHEFREFRIERDKAEKAARLAERAGLQTAAAPAVTPASSDGDKADAIRAAMARAAERQAAPVATSADDAKKAAIEAAMARAAARKAERDTAENADAAATPPAATMDDAKQAAIQAAMARAAAKQSTRETARAGQAEAEPPRPALDEAKRAAIEAAMTRAAARKAERASAEATDEPATGPDKPTMDDAKKAAIQAAMERAAARRAARPAPPDAPHDSEPD